MTESGKVTPTTLHKVAAAVTALAALVAFGQVIGLVTVSDETAIQLIRIAAKQQSRPISDEQIRESRGWLLGQAREFLEKPSTWAPKAVFGLLLFGIAAGLRAGRPKPTRVVAGITGVVFLIASIAVLPKHVEALRMYEDIETWIYYLDVLWAVLLPAATICCILVARKAAWPEPEAPAGAPGLGLR